jgi:hypothetical protein
MKFSTTVQVLGLEIGLLLPVAGTAQSILGNPLEVRVSIFDDAGVGVATMREAESEASRVFRRANIEVIWLNCPQDGLEQISFDRCAAASFPTHLHLRVIPRAHSAKVSTMGMSFLSADGEGCYADLFYEVVVDGQMETHVRAVVILGHAMAHELGHLLLGTNSHSRDGLMRARWNRGDLAQAARGNLLFSPKESTRMRSRFTRDDTRTETAQME